MAEVEEATIASASVTCDLGEDGALGRDILAYAFLYPGSTVHCFPD